MAGKTITMSNLKQIIRHRDNGMALQTISKTLGIARNTVKKYLQLIDSKGFSYGELLSMNDEELDALLSDPDHVSGERYQELISFFPYMEPELKRTGVNRWVLWGEYRQKHPDGYSYSQFCESFRQWRTGLSASMRIEHVPGDKFYIDFTGDRLSIVDPVTGELTDLEVYVATLGASQYSYVEAIPSQRKEDFIAATENALHYLGGVPRALVPDNLKSAVTKADKYEPAINPDFLDFANHYGCVVFPARSRKPQDKALVEKTVSIVYSRIYAPLRNKVYHDINTLNADIRHYLNIHNNTPFQKRPETRKELFDREEKGTLAPLPAERYELKQFKYATVTKTSHISLNPENHYYSIPYRYIGKKVKVVYSASYVSVFYDGERIAFHKRSLKERGYTTVQDHMPSAHRFVSDWNPEFFLNWAKGIHPEVRHYLQVILDSYPYPEQAYKSCLGILGYDKKAGRERLINAVIRAKHYNTYNYSVITRILNSGMDSIPLDTENKSDKSVDHENIRGAESFR
ncbi:IS21 family transposase [Echinicola marina]|uniref:IS21 family transposase n=1 Tax=Echinicola marina TaxID=2859768 RepID=UPI001CF6BF6C|nr:IS21 family transposase [Echinicola marina]UCS91959.1 IS21 family transposase [Echinicola marina]UCS92309.1 IS21 family transposase [Echinicola marina]UCS92444.1 IS21 family transposase [Echinicola marina]UCS93174.1 IS21 family transposase [Echinicola marina]UCS93946.1 IS21 family transposase [Echinicola marina]